MLCTSSCIDTIANMFDKLKAAFKSKGITWQNQDGNGQGNFIPISSLGCNWLVNCARTGSYDNTFPNISRIAEAFAEVRPYAVDINGQRMKKQPRVVEALYNPNADMSGSDFLEALIVMMLVHPVVYLLCWRREGGEIRPGGPITKDNIASFTFLEGYSVSTSGGETTYTNGANTYTRKDVIALSLNVNPYDLMAGYSPTLAIKKWANIDDYIAEYQSGVFRNGAVPAGMFVVTAPTADEFNQTVDNLQKHHRGAQNANNVIYVHRPTSSIDGKPMGAQIEWIPFAQTNKDMTLDKIFEQANLKIDMNFGVPEEVKGHVSNSTYASAEVADYIFARRVVYPKLVKVYSKLTHELNRVTHGLGCSISFDYDLPVLTDSRKVQVETLQMLLSSGFTVESAVNALQLPKSFLQLTPEAVPEAENMEVQENVDDKPSQNEEENKIVKDVKNKDVDVTVQTDEIWRQSINQNLLKAMRQYLRAVIDKAVEEVEANPGLYDNPGRLVEILQNWLKNEYHVSISNQVMSVIVYLMTDSGNRAIEDFVQKTGLEEISFAISDTKLQQINERIDGLIEKFGNETISHIVTVINQAKANSEPSSSAVSSIDALKQGDDYRAERWAASEQHIADGEGIQVAAEEFGEAHELNTYKTWRVNPASPDRCAECLEMNGETVKVNEVFSNGEMIPHYHPYCYCVAEYDFVYPFDDMTDELIAPKSVKVFCPHCKRYMLESANGSLKNVICGNGKCKKHYDIEVKNGEVKTKEVNHDDCK